MNKLAIVAIVLGVSFSQNSFANLCETEEFLRIRAVKLLKTIKKAQKHLRQDLEKFRHHPDLTSEEYFYAEAVADEIDRYYRPLIREFLLELRSASRRNQKREKIFRLGDFLEEELRTMRRLTVDNLTVLKTRLKKKRTFKGFSKRLSRFHEELRDYRRNRHDGNFRRCQF